MIDEGSEFGARVARHLREETVVWLTTFAQRFSVPVRIRIGGVHGR